MIRSNLEVFETQAFATFDTLDSSQGSRFVVRCRLPLLRRMTFVTSIVKEVIVSLRLVSNPLPK